MTTVMTSLPVAGLMLSLAAMPARAQTPPDFSGTWRLDPSQTKTSGGPIRAGGPGQAGAITPPVRIKNVAPTYPPAALKSRLEGQVTIEAVIDRKGNVADARVLRSIPELDQAALDAVLQWKFRPSLLNGEPVPVLFTANVTFFLGRGRATPSGPPPGAAPPEVGSGSGGGTGRGLGPGSGSQSSEITITQTAEALVATRETGAGRETLTYRFDGAESRNRQLGRSGGPPGEYVTVSRWDEAKLVSTVTGPDGSPASRTETRFLEGDTMVVESVRPAPDGAPPWVARQVYVRVRIPESET